MRSVRKRSILYVCEHFEHEYNEENTFLDDYLYKKSHPYGQERIYKTLSGDNAKKTEVTEGIRRQASTAYCLSNPDATETLR